MKLWSKFKGFLRTTTKYSLLPDLEQSADDKSTNNGNNNNKLPWNKKLICFFFTIITFMILLTLMGTDDPFLTSKWRGLDDDNLQSVGAHRPAPLILSWNNFWDLSITDWLRAEYNVSKCPFLCRYSNDHALEANASIIIFHIRKQITPLPGHRTPNQLYAFFLMESPTHSCYPPAPKCGNHRSVAPDFFNISLTFRGDSDVPVFYDTFVEFKSKDGEDADVGERWSQEEVLRKVSAKSQLALQFVSNCNTPSGREKYVKQLKKHINVTDMGACANRKGCNAECAVKLYDSHFFYLAFENSVCRHYVTEKFWNIKRLIVPVVLTRSVFVGLNIPEDAFIAADDFDSAEQLAAHLKKVAADRRLYMNYLQWTRRFKRTSNRQEVLNPLCQLCQLAHEQPRERRIRDIVQFWEGEGRCIDRFVERRLLT